MKRLSTFVLAALVAGATYALPLKVAETPTSLKGEKAAASLVAAPAKYALMQDANAAVAKKSAANNQLRAEAWQKAHALDRNILTETAKRALKPAADGETADTVFITPMSLTPTWYADTKDWFLGFYDVTGNYIVKLDWFGSADSPYGTYTIDDIDPSYSYIVDYVYGGYVNYVTCDFTFSGKQVSKNLSVVSLDAVIEGDNGQVYVVNGSVENLSPQDTVNVTIDNATIGMANDSTLVLEGANETASVKATIASPYVVGEYNANYFDMDNTEIKVNGKEVEIWDIVAVVDADSTASHLLADIQVLGTDTVVYNILLSYPLPAPTDTIAVTCPNLEIDDSWAAWFGIYFVSASNGDLAVDLITAGAEAGVYTTLEGSLAGGLSVGKKSIDMWGGKLTISETIDGDITADLECYGSDFNYYKIHMLWEVPVPTDTVTVSFATRATTYGYPTSGLLQMISANSDIRVATATGNWKAGERFEFTTDDALLGYTYIRRYVGNDTILVQAASATGVVELVGDTTKMTAEVIGFDSVLYRVSHWFAVPQPKETKTFEIKDAEFTNALADNMYQITGTTANGDYVISFTPAYTTTVEGTYEDNGKFTQVDFNQNYTWVMVAGETEEGDEYLDVLKGKVVVTMDADNNITAAGSFICSDDVEYKFTMLTKYDKAHIDYDMPDTPVDATFTTENYEFEIDDDYWQSYGVVDFYAYGLNNADYLALEFIPATVDATTILPAGEYEINDTYEEGTATAGDFDGYYVYPCFFAQVTSTGYLSTEGMYFLVSGKITVEKVGEADLHIVVDALNSYDVPVKIDINTTTTAINNVEKDAAKAVKFVKNGQLYIQRGEKVYNVLGAMAE
ncbi:MAG: hypothetical protein ACI4BD_02465 [Paludibacteraceae bacterium]